MINKYKVIGMGCDACVHHVQQAASGIPGVQKAAVDLASETLTVTFDPEQVTYEILSEAVDEAGYELAGPAEADV